MGPRCRIATGGLEADGDSEVTSDAISADGRFVVFTSAATNLIPGGDVNGVEDVFVHDRQSGATSRISEATDLVPGVVNAHRDVFVHDFISVTTDIASADDDGLEGNAASTISALSADAGCIAFDTFASNFDPDDTNTRSDIYVHMPSNVGITAYGTLRVGGTQTLSLYSPQDVGRVYITAGSLSTSPGILFGEKVFPLNADPWFMTTLTTPALFSDFIGTFDSNGRATPQISMPPYPILAGFRFWVAAMSVDPSTPPYALGISRAIEIVILP